MAPRRHLRSRDVAFAVATVLTVLAAFEVALRVAPGRRGNSGEFYDDIYDLSYAMVPGATNPYSPIHESINTHGFRGDAYPEAKPPGTVRVVCLGDSCTFGFRVRPAESYPAELERQLRAADPGRRIEVINGGVPGTDFYQHLLLLREKLVRFDPDLVIVWSHPNWTWSIKRFRDRLDHPPLYASFQRPLRRLEIYRGLRRALKQGPARAAVYDSGGSDEERREDRDDVFLQDYVRDLDDLRHLSRRDGFALAFTNYPTRRSVLEPSIHGPGYDFKFHGALERFCRRHGYPLIDLVAGERGIATREYFLDKVHPTAVGFALIATIIRRALEANGMPAPAGVSPAP